MALIDRIRKAVRVTARQVPDSNGVNPGEDGYVLTMGSPFDDELSLLISAAKRDLLRVGIRNEIVDPENEADMDVLVEQAITLYVKAFFGYDNNEADRFNNSYRMAVIDLMNSPANSSAWEPQDD